MDRSFVHLHTHTDYSMLDGAAKIEKLLDETKRLGMKSLAITDHGNLHGVYKFFKEAQAREIKPIIGIEAYVAPKNRFFKEAVRWGDGTSPQDDVSGRGLYTHLTLLAYNREGVYNLLHLSTLSYQEGMVSRYPRMDYELLSKFSGGLIATTSCPSGEVQTRLRLNQDQEAYRAIDNHIQIFGKENYYVELMNHNIALESSLRDKLYELPKKFNLKPLVTNDSHYISKNDNKIHDIMLAIQTRKTIYDANRFKFDGEQYYLKSPEEMYAIDSNPIWQDGCRNTCEVADRVDNDGVFLHKDLMPKFPDDKNVLRKRCEDNLIKRVSTDDIKVYRERLDYELKVIEEMGFSSYFLIVHKIVELAFSLKILRGPGRGSVSGSLVAYLLNITDIDPLIHNLIFERFLNPHRVTMPDIDIDIDDKDRERLIDAVTETWGKSNVANVATFMIIKARSAVRDVSRVLNYPVSKANEIVKLLPEPIMGRTAPLTAIYSEDEERYRECESVRNLCAADPEVKKIIDYSIELEGSVRQVGVHAAALILSKDPLYKTIPLYNKSDDKRSTTQFDYYSCEELGALKIDLLGLSNLSIIKETFRSIGKEEEVFNLANFDYSDKKTYGLLSEGKTLGIFQLDNVKVQELLRLVKPNCLEDIAAIIALYRPGPMGDNAHINYAYRKNGKQDIDYIDSEIESKAKEILEPTYGLLVYQEQVQKIAQVVAGYSPARADNLRRAMGKKDRDLLDREYKYFKESMIKRGYSDRVSEKLWKILVPFSSYAFNKAHAIGYACISYITAYLKTHYTAFFMMSVMRSIETQEKRNLYREDNERNFKIKLLPPHVNISSAEYTVNGDGNIVYGFDDIKGFSKNVAQAIVEERRNKPYKSVFDLICRLYNFQQSKGVTGILTQKSIEILEKIGGFRDMPLYSGGKVGANAIYTPIANSSSRVKDKPLLEIIFSFLRSLSRKNKPTVQANNFLSIYRDQIVDTLKEKSLRDEIFSKHKITNSYIAKLTPIESQTQRSKDEYDLLGHYIEDPSLKIESSRTLELKDTYSIADLKDRIRSLNIEDVDKVLQKKKYYGIVHSIEYAPNKKDLVLKLWFKQESIECRVAKLVQNGRFRERRLSDLLHLLERGEILDVNRLRLSQFSQDRYTKELLFDIKKSGFLTDNSMIINAVKKDIDSLMSQPFRFCSDRLANPEKILHKVMECRLRSFVFRDTIYFFIDKIERVCSFEGMLQREQRDEEYSV